MIAKTSLKRNVQICSFLLLMGAAIIHAMSDADAGCIVAMATVLFKMAAPLTQKIDLATIFKIQCVSSGVMGVCVSVSDTLRP